MCPHTKDIPLYDFPGALIAAFGFKLYKLKSYQSSGSDTDKGDHIPLKTNVPHRHNFYEICIFQDGGGVHEIDFKTHPVKPYSLHFISPGQVHLLKGSVKNNGYVLTFTDDFFSSETLSPGWLADLPFFNVLQAHPILQLDHKQFSYILNLLGTIESDFYSMRDSSRPIIQSYVKVLLLKCNYFFIQGERSLISNDDSAHKLVGQFKHLLERYFNSKHQVQDYSELLNVTPAHINRCCKLVLGKPVSELIHHRIILEAKRLLLYTDWTSKEIAYHLQYQDPGYFSRVFKKRTRLTPSEFRDQNAPVEPLE